jgi:hypothetical protein
MFPVPIFVGQRLINWCTDIYSQISHEWFTYWQTGPSMHPSALVMSDAILPLLVIALRGVTTYSSYTHGNSIMNRNCCTDTEVYYTEKSGA